MLYVSSSSDGLYHKQKGCTGAHMGYADEAVLSTGLEPCPQCASTAVTASDYTEAHRVGAHLVRRARNAGS